MPRRIDHLIQSCQQVRDARLDMNPERIAETFSMVMSKVKLDLMDNSSPLVRKLNRIFFDDVDYNHLFDNSLSKEK